MQKILQSKLFIGAILAVAAVATAAVVAVNVSHSGSDLQTQLDLGNRYVSELDYENAIIAYEEALKIDPYCLEAYLGLADAYMALGQPDKAIEIMQQAKNMLPESVEVYVSLAQLYASQNQMDLVVSTLEEGIGVTDSDRLKEMLGEYQPEETQLAQAQESQTAEAEEEEEVPGDVLDLEDEEEVLIVAAPQQNTVPVPAVAGDGEETAVIPLSVPVQEEAPADNSGSGSDEGNGGGSDHSSGDTEDNNSGNDDSSGGDNNGENTGTIGISGVVKDTSGTPLQDVHVTLKLLDDTNGSEEIVAVTDADGNYQLSLKPGRYASTYAKPGYGELYVEITAIADGFYYNPTLLTLGQMKEASTVTVDVKDVVSVNPVEKVSVSFYEGYVNPANQGDAVAVATAETDANGQAKVNLDHAGYYTILIQKDGYIKVYHYCWPIWGKDFWALLHISPLLQSENQYRIVLTWGAKPSILDSHFFGEDSDGTPYHICWYRWKNTSGTAFLDVDHMGGYGPETITANIDVTKQQRFIVHNYSGGGDMVLSESGAKVQVYGKEGLVYEASVPNTPGTTWHVFNIVNGVVVPVNKVDFSTDSIYPPDGYGELNYATHVYVNSGSHSAYSLCSVDENGRDIVGGSDEYMEEEDEITLPEEDALGDGGGEKQGKDASGDGSGEKQDGDASEAGKDNGIGLTEGGLAKESQSGDSSGSEKDNEADSQEGKQGESNSEDENDSDAASLEAEENQEENDSGKEGKNSTYLLGTDAAILGTETDLPEAEENQEEDAA